ncbi:MAG: winged helix-turn-helix domain-containing protein [Alphaproteobacteria bacterium]|nr:winged helix-turn-helix domain-containing protein [Alphaproteobacteria bacterium]
MTQVDLSRDEARHIALAAQGFDAAARRREHAECPILGAVEDMGLLQIDSVNVLVRAHYLPVFSRLGHYERSALDSHAFNPAKRRLFEYWAHEASLLPLAMQPLLRWRMARAQRLEGIYGGYVRFARRKRALIASVLAELRLRGPSPARAFAGDGKRVKGMWERHDGKIALEYLFWSGQVGSVTRAGIEKHGFERVYDVIDRVLPADILALPTPNEADAQRELMRFAARAFGVATETDLRDYFRMPVAAAKQRLNELVEAGELRPVRVEGWRHQAYLDRSARPAANVDRAALISPFDPLIWYRDRTERLFGFHYRLEIYTPEAKRRFGYYVLPVLHRGKLVGRLDLKADRASSALLVRAAGTEAGVEQGPAAEAMAGELQRMAAWLGLERVAVGRRGNLARVLSATVRRQRASR